MKRLPIKAPSIVQWLFLATFVPATWMLRTWVLVDKQKLLATETATTASFLAPRLDSSLLQVPVSLYPEVSVPIVVISSLRHSYLGRVLEAIQPKNQNPHTPDWILNSKRYVFADRNIHTDKNGEWELTKKVANDYGYQFHTFEGLTMGKYPPTKPIRSYYTKQMWYKMMRHLFTILNETEVLILEDDAVLAYDGLLVAARLLMEKHKRSDVHNIALGGHAGENKKNPHHDTFLAVQSRYFQAMAYSLNATLFHQIDIAYLEAESQLANRSQASIDRHENHVSNADWTMEITSKRFLTNITQLEPTVGRMHHIGIFGMGYNGNGKKHTPFPIPWEFCNSSIYDVARTLDTFYLASNKVMEEKYVNGGYRPNIVPLPPTNRQWVPKAVVNHVRLSRAQTLKYRQSIRGSLEEYRAS